ncbi:inositol 1,3,4-trisphosphate 5/6-kinase 4 isoform X2 [Cornus florida]|uniref:inositol 1,3,4-trisphosphate 5/6-kinase 4 isoform X2 n=1 Tax=Cornus florida TaxID=4283 RepID=UPI00289FBAD0|nr:inositol 1,3,4-trisphosphate 5/6-kinase 4 isoform X2 [Cornus florida]
MGAIAGILLDSSVLLASDDDSNGNASLRPGAGYLLRRLHYSKIHTGIAYGLGLSAHKVELLESMARQYSFDCFILNATTVENTMNEIVQAWGDNGRSFLHVISNKNIDLFLNIQNRGWMIVILNVDSDIARDNSSMLYIDKLEELPLTICRLNRKASSNDIVTVGYVMKPSREEDFAKRGAFPLYPTQNGLIFMPLTFELTMSSQLQEVDIVLHKATDEIVSVEMSNSSEFINKVTYTRGMQELARFIEHQPNFCVIDPLNNIYPVLDRLKIQQILLGLETLKREGRCEVRPPNFLKVDNFNEPNLVQRLSEAKLSLPCIVKPQVACGVADAHSMAIVFGVENFEGLNVPLPAVVQEYVDHSSSLFKFYVLGEKVFYAVKKSTPNADILAKLSERNGPKPLHFDSLKSLPTGAENPHFGDGDFHKVNDQRLDVGLVTDAASWLRRMLNLTIFGFDVVIQERTGDHVIVDVNYLPSFKEVPDNDAIPAFWEAIKRKFELTETKQTTIASS